VHPVAAHSWKNGAHLLQSENNPHGGAMLMPDGSAPRAGDVSFSCMNATIFGLLLHVHSCSSPVACQVSFLTLPASVRHSPWASHAKSTNTESKFERKEYRNGNIHMPTINHPHMVASQVMKMPHLAQTFRELAEKGAKHVAFHRTLGRVRDGIRVCHPPLCHPPSDQSNLATASGREMLEWNMRAVLVGVWNDYGGMRREHLRCSNM
jgi:hypothetical protein